MERRFVYAGGTLRVRNHLPHLDVAGGLYFVTFCLLDAVRPGFLRTLSDERRRLIDQVFGRFGRVNPSDEIRIGREIRRMKFEEMDRGHGECLLARPEIASMVSGAIRFFDGDRYAIYAYSVMPNHVHAILRAGEEWPWWKIVGGWKSFTARAANRILGRRGELWLDDNHERLLRNERELERAIEYTLDNPRKAGLRPDWTEQLLSHHG
jgi:REP element-mobilizing transposase RayT